MSMHFKLWCKLFCIVIINYFHFSIQYRCKQNVNFSTYFIDLVCRASIKIQFSKLQLGQKLMNFQFVDAYFSIVYVNITKTIALITHLSSMFIVLEWEQIKWIAFSVFLVIFLAHFSRTFFIFTYLQELNNLSTTPLYIINIEINKFYFHFLINQILRFN